MSTLSEVPEGWQLARLGDVADISFSSVDKKSVAGEIDVTLCNYTDVFYNRRIRPGMDFMPATATPREHATWSLRQDDVLFTKDSETPDEIGIPSHVTDDLPGVLCGYHLGLARPQPAVLEGAFLTEVLGSEISRRKFARVANGTTRFGLTLESARSVYVLLPPLVEQCAIAEILNSVDETIEAAESVILSTEQLRDSLLRELLTYGTPGRHSEWREDPRLGTIPAEWRAAALGDVAEIAFSGVDKRSTPDENPVRLCNYTDVFYNRRIRPEMDFMNATATSVECNRWRLKRGDVLFTKDSETRDEIGVPSYVTEDMPEVLCGYHLALARPRPSRVDGAFLTEVLASHRSRVQFSRIANGTIRFGLTLDSTRAIPIPLPCLDEQETIASVLLSIDTCLEQTRTELASVHRLRSSVSHVLLAGLVRTIATDV